MQLNEALAWIAYAEGKKDDALKLMRAAADEEDAVEKRPVTPGAIVPAREQLGDILLESNRAQEAINEFENALTMSPQRRGAVMGQARARQIVAAEKQLTQYEIAMAILIDETKRVLVQGITGREGQARTTSDARVWNECRRGRNAG